jgi:hypothetical protein
MIVAKGDHVFFTMVNGKIVRCPRSYKILHDTEGEHFGKCTVLFRNVSGTEWTAPLRGKARAYFGARYDLRLLKVPRWPAASSFKVVGPVQQIDYVRYGEYAGPYFHPFKLGVHPILAKSGNWYRLDLGEACVYDDRGFVFP